MVGMGLSHVLNGTQPWSELVSAMVAVKKKDGTVGICIDPVHLNKVLLRPHNPIRTVEQVISDMSDLKVFSVLNSKCGFWQIPLDEASSKLTMFMISVRRTTLSNHCGQHSGLEMECSGT